MDKKLLDNPNLNLRNGALEGAIEDCVAERNSMKKLEIVIRLLRDSQVIVPVSFPPDADQEIVSKLLSGQPIKKAENMALLPVTLRDPEGNKFAPVFTSREKIEKTDEFPFMVRIPAEQVVRNVLNEKADFAGVIINPQGKGFIIRKKAFTIDFSKQTAEPGQPQTKTVSKEEFTVLARNTAEKMLLPRQLFTEKGEFVARLEERGEEVLSELYAKPYADKVPSPYTPDDFSILSLGIDEQTTAVCIELPEKNRAPHLASSAYVIWNEETGELHYYLIEKGEPGKDDMLCSVTADGKHQEVMTAPAVGSELSAVLELIQKNN